MKDDQKQRFFNFIRVHLFSRLSQRQVIGIEAILDQAAMFRMSNTYLAYILATAHHETGGALYPVIEKGSKDYFLKYDVRTPSRRRRKRNIKMGNDKVGDGYRYRGRGFVQLTFKNNYIRAGKRIGIDLKSYPHLALGLEASAKILVEGMRYGWFTGKALRDFDLGKGKLDFVKARKVVNGDDRAILISNYAKMYYYALYCALEA